MKQAYLLPLYLSLIIPAQGAIHFVTIGWEGYSEGRLDYHIGWDTTTTSKANYVQISDGKAIWGDDTNYTFYHNTGVDLDPGESLFYAMKVTTTGGNGVHSFAGMREAGSASYSGRAFVDQVGEPNYRIGISNSEAVESGWDTSSAGQQYGQEYTIVVGYDYDTGVSTLWLNPASIASSNITTSGAPSAANKELIEFVFLSGSGDGSVHAVSALAIADTFDEALSAIPEPSQFAILAGLCAGALTVQRRRR